MTLTQNNVKKNGFFTLKDFDKKQFFSTNRVGYNVRKVNKVNAVYYEQKDCIFFIQQDPLTQFDLNPPLLAVDPERFYRSGENKKYLLAAD